MTSPFGKFEVPSAGSGAPWAPTQPAPADYTPSTAPTYATATGAHIDGIGSDIADLLVPGEPVLASISLKKGDLTITLRRILIQHRDGSLGGDKATWVIQRQQSVSMVWAKALDSGIAGLATIFLLGGLVAGLYALNSGLGVEIVVAVVAIGAGILGFVLAMRAAIAVDAGSARATVRVETNERARAARFFAAATTLMTDL